ncbi:MAG TPA: acyltransferase [Vicinamibacterales bacterium]
MADLPGGAESRPRRGYLDWMRGLAVLIMIEAHVIDSWTRAADRQSWQYGWSTILGGFGAPLFLFLAGVSVALSAASKARRLGDPAAAVSAVVRRGFEIFLLAFVFRVQAWVLGLGAPSGLLKVDILNIMGPSIMAAAVLWGWGAERRRRYAIYALAMLVTTLITPLVRSTALLDGVPDPLEAYLRPVRGLTNFAFFPWAGFVFGGAILGVAIDASRTRESEARLNLVFLVAGAAIAIAAYAGSFRPTPYPRSDFWTSSPSFFFIRAGLMTMAIAVAYAWEAWRPARWSPMQQLGRTSLFIYWIHVELVYGLISLPLHKRLPLGGAWLALGAFCVFMLGCSIVKDRVVAKWRARNHRQPMSLDAHQPLSR